MRPTEDEKRSQVKLFEMRQGKTVRIRIVSRAMRPRAADEIERLRSS